MALIKCLECGHEVSDKAVSCPKCGCPILRTKQIICSECGSNISQADEFCPKCGCPNEDVDKPNSGYLNINSIKIILILFVVILVVVGLTNYFNHTSNFEASQTPTITDVKEEETNKETLLKDVVGTYKFDYAQEGRFSCAPIVVLDDGRCVILYQTVSGNVKSKFIGKVEILSKKVFTLTNGDDFTLDLNTYAIRGGKEKCIGHTYEWRWNFYDKLVFDLKENRLYHSYDEYLNRDVSEAEYSRITNHTKSTSLNQ